MARKMEFSVTDVMARYHVTRQTVHNWVRKGWVKRSKIGGRVYFTADALREFENR